MTNKVAIINYQTRHTIYDDDDIYIYMTTYTCIPIRVYLYVYAYTCIPIRVHIYMCIHIYVYTYICVTYICMYTHAYVYISHVHHTLQEINTFLNPTNYQGCTIFIKGFFWRTVEATGKHFLFMRMDIVDMIGDRFPPCLAIFSFR